MAVGLGVVPTCSLIQGLLAGKSGEKELGATELQSVSTSGRTTSGKEWLLSTIASKCELFS